MAKLPVETLATLFMLMQRLAILIEEAKAADFAVFEKFGETEATIPELEQIQNGIERLKNLYNRLQGLAIALSESQPTAPTAILNILAPIIEEIQISADAVEATVQETKKNWNLP